MIKISIIIPVYNGAKTITRTLDSIVNQNVGDDIEVIVVNDCSTDNTQQVLEEYQANVYPNLVIVNLPENHKIGGARNAGIAVSNGEYIQCLDGDDLLIEGALKKLLQVLTANPNIDLVLFDYLTVEEGTFKLLDDIKFAKNHSRVIGGEEYITTQGVPWTAWLALYKKSFLYGNNIHYADHVLFEDSDYVLKSIMLAKSIKYEPIAVLKYMISGNSTSNIGNNKTKIEERLMSEDRIFNVITLYKDTHPHGVEVIRGHYKFKYHAILLRNVWRLDYKSILELLKTHPYREANCDDRLINFVMEHPHAYAGMSVILGPILKLLLRIRNMIMK